MWAHADGDPSPPLTWAAGCAAKEMSSGRVAGLF